MTQEIRRNENQSVWLKSRQAYSYQSRKTVTFAVDHLVTSSVYEILLPLPTPCSSGRQPAPVLGGFRACWDTKLTSCWSALSVVLPESQHYHRSPLTVVTGRGVLRGAPGSPPPHWVVAARVPSTVRPHLPSQYSLSSVFALRFTG